MATRKSPLLNKKNADDRVVVRQATKHDLALIKALSEVVYGSSGMPPYTLAQLRGHQSNFPEGQFVVTFGETVIGYCATFRISGKLALANHSWVEITGNGFGSRHQPEGDYLYGMEVCIDPNFRGLRIGERLYNARKRLCEELKLKGIIFGGRLPGFRRNVKKFPDPKLYVDAVQAKKFRDPVISFQLHNDFEVIGLIPDYLPNDFDSMGYAVHMLWRNPYQPSEQEEKRKTYGGRLPETVRICSVQYMQRKVTSFEDFMGYVRYFVDVAADYSADFVLFPEMLSLQLLSIEDQQLDPAAAIEALTRHTGLFCEQMREMAVRYNINIIGGSHPTKMPNGRVENICYIFLRDGRVETQAKIHPTPNEVYWWNIEGGHSLKAIDTDCGPIGILICYDSEFPELGRYLVDQGVNIIFVPFCTDERQSYLRVRYCCQARAVENQCFVAMSGNVGNLPNVANMDIQYAQSCILTPCDFPFARDGIAADTTPNAEMVAIADLRLDSIRVARNNGTVQNLKDRRHDLYSVVWRNRKEQ